MLYAIGDIHGCLGQLERLLDRIAPTAMDEVVFLGDYVDRGPSSRAVVELLLARRGPHWKFLRGNHEQMLLDWLESPAALPSDLWFKNGGAGTLQSYLPSLSREDFLLPENAMRLHDAIPKSHAAFFRATALFYETPDAFFCHAGVDLGRPLSEQSKEDLLWIRDAFWGDPRSCPKLIVSGHTPRTKVEEGKDRINLDTGCVYGGPLTALRLPGRELVQVYP
jgi:serine/threonine protein phosphatase 1